LFLTLSRRFFPSTEPLDTNGDGTEEKTGVNKDDEWEEVKEGGSAENGAPEVQAETEAISQMDTDVVETPKIE